MEVWMLLTIGTVIGGSAIWFGKDFILKTIVGAEALATKLRAKADAITAAARKV